MASHLAEKHTTRTDGRPLGEMAAQPLFYSNDQKCTAKHI